jgi:hypothetical protein
VISGLRGYDVARGYVAQKVVCGYWFKKKVFNIRDGNLAGRWLGVGNGVGEIEMWTNEG